MKFELSTSSNQVYTRCSNKNIHMKLNYLVTWFFFQFVLCMFRAMLEEFVAHVTLFVRPKPMLRDFLEFESYKDLF